MQNLPTYTIGEAAKILGLSIETLRRYDRSGKITVQRTPGGKRFFTKEDIERIKNSSGHLHEFNHTVEEIEKLNDINIQTPLQSERIVLSVSIPKLSFPKFNFNFTKISIALVILLLFVGNIFFFLKSPYSQQAVLGAETFIAPAIEEGGPISSIFIGAGKTFSALGSLFKNNPFSSLVVSLVQKLENPILSDNLNVKGKAHFAKDIEGLGNLKIKGTATVGKLVTGIVDPYLIENDGNVQSTLEIRSIGDIALEPGTSGSGNVTLGGNNISGVNNLTTTNLNSTNLTTNTLTIQGSIQTPKITTTSDATIGGNITLTGVINSNTLTSTSLVFAGSSPSIYPSTTNTGISLNANGTGAINIGNSSKGDIYLGGGSTSGTYCLITNSSASLNCSSDITSGGNLFANGGYLKTTSTTGYLFNTTATTLNIGGAATTISLGASSGTTTINNALTVTGISTFTGASTFNSNVSITSGGQLSLTRVPTLAHTGTWAIGSSTWNQSDATIYVNPASATADSNIFSLSVGGSVKFDIDAEGDVYGNNLILTGNTTSASTTVAGDLTVEGNTTLGDATTDTLTIKPSTISITGAPGTETLDLTGAATQTLTLLNSTVAQVANLNLSDGSLYLGGSIALDNSKNATLGTISGSSLTATSFTTAGVVLNSSAGLLSTLAGTTTTVLHGNASGAPTFASITGSDLSSNFTVSTTGNLVTTGSGVVTSAGTLTASNGLTLTTGALSLTGTSGSIALTGFGTTAITSTTASGDVLAVTDSSLDTASSNLSNFTFKNNNTGAGVEVRGVTITEQAAGTPSSGTNTSNLLNLAAAAGGTVNGINISSATGFTNFFKTPTVVIDATGALSGVTTLTATTLAGTLSTASQTSITAVGTLSSLAVTGNINSTTGGLQTNSITRIDNSGNLTAGTGNFSGTVTIGSGTGKVDVGTVDPPYTIDGKRYATYLPSVTGVKEETTGTIKIDQTGKYEINFARAAEGSDMWLFYQITDFGKNWENLTVLLTPNFEGRVWYVKNQSSKK